MRRRATTGRRAVGGNGFGASVVEGRPQDGDVVGAGGGRGRLGVLGGPVAVEEVLLQCVHAPTLRHGLDLRPVN